MATSLAPESAVRACSAAPVPRPPQPTRPTLIVLLPAAWTRGTVKPVETAVAVAAHHGGRRALQEIAPRGGRGRCSRWFGRGSSVEVGQSRRDLRWRDRTVPVGSKLLDPPNFVRIMVTRQRAGCYAISLAWRQNSPAIGSPR